MSVLITLPAAGSFAKMVVVSLWLQNTPHERRKAGTNMKTRQTILTLTAGTLLGVSVAGPLASAAENYLKATPSAQRFFVDGQRVELEAYAIEGHNYVKLRDIGRAVDFGVSYDPQTNSVIVTSGMPYQDDTPAEMTTDHAAQVNSSALTGYLTRDVYNTIRQTVVTGQTTPFGSAVSGMMGLKYGDDEELFQKGEQEIQQLQNVLATLGRYPDYRLTPGVDSYLCEVQQSEIYVPAAEHTKDFIASLDGLSDRDKVKRMAWYVCDRIAYDKTCYAWPHEVLAQNGIRPGACMSYAYSFQFLCQQADIPCILKHGGNHQWNMVYAEGRWWDVDVTANDCDGVTFHETDGSTRHRPFDGTDDFREQFYVTADRVLRTEGPFPDEDPEITRFAQEVLVPGASR